MDDFQRAKYASVKLKDLKEIIKDRKLMQSGKKRDLIDR